MTVYIYGLFCPVVGKIRYIGKSVNPEKRYYQHLSDSRLSRFDFHVSRWIRKLLLVNLKPKLIILEKVSGWEKWQDVEKRWIRSANLNNWPLTNLTKGGDGPFFLNEEDDRRYRESVSVFMKDFWNSPEKREELSKRSLNMWADPEIRERIISANQEARSRPEIRERFLTANKEAQARPEVKKKRSVQFKAMWEDDEYRSKKLDQLKSDEFREERSKNIRARWDDPVSYTHLTLPT